MKGLAALHVQHSRGAPRLGDMFRLRHRLIFGGGALITVLVLLTAVVSAVAQVQEFHAHQRHGFNEARAALDYYLVQRDRAYATSINGTDVLWRDQRAALALAGSAQVERFHAQGEEVVIRAKGRTAVPWLVLGQADNPLPPEQLKAYLGMIEVYSAYTADSITSQEAVGPVSIYAYEPRGRLLAVSNVRDEAQLLQILGVATRQQAFARLLRDEARMHHSKPQPGPIRAATQQGRLWSHFGINPLNGQPSVVGVVTMAEGARPYLRRVVFESINNLKTRLEASGQGRYLVQTGDSQHVVLATGGLTPAEQSLLSGSLSLASSALPARRYSHGRFVLSSRLPGVDWTLSQVYGWREIWQDRGTNLFITLLGALLIIGLLWWLLRRIDRRVFTPALADAVRVYESEALSRTILTTAPMGLALLARDSGTPLLQNDAARTLLEAADASPTPLYGRLAELGQGGATDDVLELHWTGDEQAQGAHLQISVAQGSYHDQAVWVCALRDVTAQAELEENLRRAREDAEAARRSAEAASQAKSAFVATMSHEIRTPLNGVLGHLELMARSELQPAQRERLDRIRFSADALMRVISDVLDFSKIEAGQLDVEVAPFALRPLIEGVALLFAPDAARKGVRLYFTVEAPADVACVGDAHRIRQILTNLVGNAVKFTASGRIVLRANLEETGGEGARLRLQVVDSGIGMSAEQVAQVFQPFQQADASVSRCYGGSGLGLALCQQLAQAMGGQVCVESTEGVGSSFSVLLPVQTQAQQCVQPLGGWRVSVLSATPEWRGEMSRLLESWGAATQVLDGPQADAQGDALLVVEGQGVWSMEEEQQLMRSHTRTVHASAQGPLTAETRNGQVEVSVYASAALLDALLGDRRVPAPAVAKSASAQPRGRVLLVEDNAVNRELIQQQLEELGYSVVASEHGQAALEQWQEGDYQAVLTDINMPVMDGYALTSELRRRGYTRPILAITATALASERERCLAAGIDDLLLKPLNLARLEAGLMRGLPSEAITAPEPVVPVLPAKLRRLFVETGTRDMEAIRQARADGDQASLLSRVHAFKGVLLMLEETEVARLCGDVEQILLAGGAPSMDALQAMERALQSCLQRHAEVLHREGG